MLVTDERSSAIRCVDDISAPKDGVSRFSVGRTWSPVLTRSGCFFADIGALPTVYIPAGLKSNPFSFFVSDGPSPTIVDCSASSRRKASARMLRAVLTSLHEMYCNCYRSKMMDLQLRQPLSPGKALASGTDLSRGERSPVASD